MNVTNRIEFQSLIECLHLCSIVAVDTETDGLKLFMGNKPISMSFYFPEFEASFNFAWGHGTGQIQLMPDHQDTQNFHNWTWQGKGKKQAYKAYWFEKFRVTAAADFQNCPLEWLDELRGAWNSNTARSAKVIYFNAPFDIHMMKSIDFDQPRYTEDVRIAVGLMFEDWNYIGTLIDNKLRPIEGHSNRLKWQASFWGIEGALDGEEDLHREIEALGTRVAELASANWDDPINSTFHKLKRAARVNEIAEKLQFDDKAELWCLPSGAAAPYAENDTKITWLLREKLLGRLEGWNQLKLYQDWCDMQAEFLIRLEDNGILLDENRAAELIDEMAPIMAEVNAWFNVEVQRLRDAGEIDDELWPKLLNAKGKLALTCGSHEKIRLVMEVMTGVFWFSTDKDHIQRYEDEYGEHEALEHLKRFKHAQRAVTTYLRNWVKSQDEHGYIHGSFNASGTITGRLSSSSGTRGDVGNFQNIPSRGFNIKECLVTPSGFGLFQIDYSALELRLASYIAQCPRMIEQFAADADLHAYTRDTVNIGEILNPGLSLIEAGRKEWAAGHLEEEPTDEASALKQLNKYYRHVAKTLNFGLLYGGTWKMVDRLLKVGEAVAGDLHYAWNSLYPEYAEANKKWMADATRLRPQPNAPIRHLYVQQPISNRTRKFDMYPVIETIYDPETGESWTSKTRKRKAKDAFNFAVQGLGGYINAMSGLYNCREHSNRYFKPFATIHDSIDFYLSYDKIDVLPQIVGVMCDWPVEPKLQVEVEYSPDGMWQHVKPITDMSLFISSGAKEGYKTK